MVLDLRSDKKRNELQTLNWSCNICGISLCVTHEISGVVAFWTDFSAQRDIGRKSSADGWRIALGG